MTDFIISCEGQIPTASYKASERTLIPETDIDDGILEASKHFIFRQGSEICAVARECDHAGGKLKLLGNGKAVCPRHGWALDVRSATYTNGIRKPIAKLPLANNRAVLETNYTYLDLPQEGLSNHEWMFEFLSHASYAVSADDFSLCTDPWIYGPCFTTGWWHQPIPPSNSPDLLAKADAIYISHIHPDHLHKETLHHYVPRGKLFLVPNFESGSVERMLRKLGFSNIIVMDFNVSYKVKKNGKTFRCAILKSGDYRDDSGLAMWDSSRKFLFTVDSNILNKRCFPRDIDVLFSNYAGGSGGFPLCFDNFDERMKKNITITNKDAMYAQVHDYVDLATPRYFVPYAGSFNEFAERDVYIRENNIKMSVDELRHRFKEDGLVAEIVDPALQSVMRFRPGMIEAEITNPQRTPLYILDDALAETFVRKYKSEWSQEQLRKLGVWFEMSGFQDNLIIFVQPTDDHFKPGACGLKVSFTDTCRAEVLQSNELLKEYEAGATENVRTKLIRVRGDSLHQVFEEGLPWEDLSIGFQCRIHRKPNTYSANFWYHFSYVYF